jgi:hypothetical protein
MEPKRLSLIIFIVTFVRLVFIVSANVKAIYFKSKVTKL